MDERVKDYREVIAYILKKSVEDFGEDNKIFYWTKPRAGQFHDKCILRNCIARMEDGATVKDFIESIDRQWERLTGDKQKDKYLVTQFFSRKNFWGEI